MFGSLESALEISDGADTPHSVAKATQKSFIEKVRKIILSYLYHTDFTPSMDGRRRSKAL